MNSECKAKIDRWIKSCGGNNLVVVIGAGFSKNAIFSGAAKIPLWNDIIARVREEIKIPDCDPLLAIDIYKEMYKHNAYEELMRDLLDDNSLSPGEVHYMLKEIPCLEAIITTNNLDTLLDKVFLKAKKVVVDDDIPANSNTDFCIYYLNGHRSRPESWINSFSDYDDITMKYPVKMSNCLTLLGKYPSLFIGFGHTDPNLHRMMRHVNKTLKDHKPAMLSLSVGANNMDSLIEYWKSVGLSVVQIIDEGSTSSIGFQLSETLKYIINKRIESLKKHQKLSPGYRSGDSFMDSLRNNRLGCIEKNGGVDLCSYHKSRSETIIKHIQDDSELISYSPFSTKIKKNGEVFKIIESIKSGIVPTGSWGLMPSHREWLLQGVTYYSHEYNPKIINVLFAGVGGLPHFVDTMSLLLSVSGDFKYQITVIDICKGPLHEINQYLEHNNYKYHTEDTAVYQEVYKDITEKQISVECSCEDLFNLNSNRNNTFDIVLSHHLVSTWIFNAPQKTDQYVSVIRDILKDGGLHISAINIPRNDENSIINIQEIMNHYSFSVVNTKLVFDFYDLDLEQTFDNDIIVGNETLLTIHKKEI